MDEKGHLSKTSPIALSGVIGETPYIYSMNVYACVIHIEKQYSLGMDDKIVLNVFAKLGEMLTWGISGIS